MDRRVKKDVVESRIVVEEEDEVFTEPTRTKKRKCIFKILVDSLNWVREDFLITLKLTLT